jgi:hypothetical protein
VDASANRARGEEPGSERSGWMDLRITRGRVGRVVSPRSTSPRSKRSPASTADTFLDLPARPGLRGQDRPGAGPQRPRVRRQTAAPGRVRTPIEHQQQPTSLAFRYQANAETAGSVPPCRLRLKQSARLVSIARAEPYGRPCRAVDGYGTPSSTRAGAHTDVRGPEVGAPGAMGAPASCQGRPRATAPR